MGVTKNHIYTQDQIELARLFKALAHPARLAIVENLLAHPNANCNDLRNYIQLAQSTISGHMKELNNAGIIAARVVGNNAFYEINKIAIEPISRYLDQLDGQLDRRFMSAERLVVYFRPQPYISQTLFRNLT